MTKLQLPKPNRLIKLNINGTEVFGTVKRLKNGLTFHVANGKQLTPDNSFWNKCQSWDYVEIQKELNNQQDERGGG